MIGLLLVVADDTPSQMCSARCERENMVPRAVCSNFPAPEKICRLTRNGISVSTIRWKSEFLLTRKFS